MTGLLPERPNKNGDTIAQAVPGTSEQRWQAFLTNMQWDEAALNRQRVQKMSAEATVGDGVLVLDDTGFAKQGQAAVGVARQDSGTLGKVGNCPLAVTCCDSDARASWPVAVRCWRVTSAGQRQVGWLVGERATRGQAEERKYAWSNRSAAATLEELAGDVHRRSAVEPFHEEATGELGWDQYQGRLWPGIHRHAVTVMLAYRFLVWLELRQRRAVPRRGRPRDPFAPAPRSTAGHATRPPS